MLINSINNIMKDMSPLDAMIMTIMMIKERVKSE